jgi:hypothetical protein
MKRIGDIFNSSNYQVHKGFHVKVPDLPNYHIKTLGVDCDPKKPKDKKTRLNPDTTLRAPNEKFCKPVIVPIHKKKKKKKKRKLKSRSYDEVKESI